MLHLLYLEHCACPLLPQEHAFEWLHSQALFRCWASSHLEGVSGHCSVSGVCEFPASVAQPLEAVLRSPSSLLEHLFFVWMRPQAQSSSEPYPRTQLVSCRTNAGDQRQASASWLVLKQLESWGIFPLTQPLPAVRQAFHTRIWPATLFPSFKGIAFTNVYLAAITC